MTTTQDVTFITRKLVFETDTTTIRLLLATASAGWTAVLAYYWVVGFPLMERQAYVVMRVLGSELVWAALFLIHFIGVVWRLYDPMQRPGWALAVNGFGFAVWTVSTIAIALAIGFVPPSTALEITMCVASGWALYRTDLKPEVVTP